MALLQISEPGMSTAPHQHRLAVGIDLGTTHSLVAAVKSGVAECLPDAQGRVLVGTNTVIFNTRQNVLTGTPLSALNRTQTGSLISGLRPVWTGRDVIYENCVEWANNLASSYGRYGMAGTGMLSQWANYGTADCATRCSLYCFEQ